MKKLLVAFIAVAFVFGLVAQTAVAEERLSMSGSVRVRAWSKSDYDFNSDVDDNQQYWDQRFRLGAVIAPADGVKAVLRCDFADDMWGRDGLSDADSVQGSAVQTDHAYMDITKGMLHLTAGLQAFALGNAVAVDAQANGLIATIKTPVSITLAYIKVDEDPQDSSLLPGGSVNRTDEEGFEDTDAYALNLGYATDTFTINGFYATVIASTDPGGSMSVIGVQGIFNVGPVNINAELNSYGGSNDATDTDFVGTQLWAVASMKMSDAMTLGGLVVYSDGEDDADKEKITNIADDGSTVYTDLGAFNTLGISAVPNDIFDPAGQNTGAMGGAVFVEFKPIETLTLNGNVGYVTAVQELDATGEFESATLLNVSAKWAFTQAASLALHYHYLSLSLADDADADPASGLGLKLQIDF